MTSITCDRPPVTLTTPDVPADLWQLATRLAEWIDANGITGNYSTAGIASRLVTQIHPSSIIRWLDQADTSFLADRCRRVKDYADLTPAEWTAENVRHGHGTFGGAR